MRRTRQMPPGRRTVRLFPGTRVDGRRATSAPRVLRQPAGGVREAIGAAAPPPPRAPATWLVAPPPPANVDEVSRATLALAVLGASAVAGTLCLETSRSAPSREREARRDPNIHGDAATTTITTTRFPLPNGGFVSCPARHPDDERVAGRGHTVGVPTTPPRSTRSTFGWMFGRDDRRSSRPRRRRESDSLDDGSKSWTRSETDGTRTAWVDEDARSIEAASSDRRAASSSDRRVSDARAISTGSTGSNRPAALPDAARRTRVVGRREDASDFAGSAEFTRDDDPRPSGFGPESSGAPPRERSRQAPEAMEAERPDAARIGDARVRAGGESRSDDDARARARSTSTARWSRPTTTPRPPPVEVAAMAKIHPGV